MLGCKKKENEKESGTVDTSITQTNGYAEQPEKRDLGACQGTQMWYNTFVWC